MKGTRVHHGQGHKLQPGEYTKCDGVWLLCCPCEEDQEGLLANLSRHHVEEHEDGTITVTPSIDVTRGSDKRWHGFLERGVMRLA